MSGVAPPNTIGALLLWMLPCVTYTMGICYYTLQHAHRMYYIASLLVAYVSTLVLCAFVLWRRTGSAEPGKPTWLYSREWRIGAGVVGGLATVLTMYLVLFNHLHLCELGPARWNPDNEETDDATYLVQNTAGDPIDPPGEMSSACIADFYLQPAPWAHAVCVEEVLVRVEEYETAEPLEPISGALPTTNVYRADIRPRSGDYLARYWYEQDAYGNSVVVKDVAPYLEKEEHFQVFVNATKPGIYTLSCWVKVRYGTNEELVKVLDTRRFYFFAADEGPSVADDEALDVSRQPTPAKTVRRTS